MSGQKYVTSSEYLPTLKYVQNEISGAISTLEFSDAAALGEKLLHNITTRFYDEPEDRDFQKLELAMLLNPQYKDYWIPTEKKEDAKQLLIDKISEHLEQNASTAGAPSSLATPSTSAGEFISFNFFIILTFLNITLMKKLN